jgi:hypothetical protein
MLYQLIRSCHVQYHSPVYPQRIIILFFYQSLRTTTSLLVNASLKFQLAPAGNSPHHSPHRRNSIMAEFAHPNVLATVLQTTRNATVKALVPRRIFLLQVLAMLLQTHV